jgi:hypothetical protein
VTTAPAVVPSRPATKARPPRGTVAGLVVVVVLLVAALALPWWSETEVFGPDTFAQQFSPFTGVTGTCSPSCGGLDLGPPTGPLRGTNSFSSVGLHDTEILYVASLGLVLAGLLLTVAALAMLRGTSKGTWSVRHPRARVTVVSVALLGVAVGAALLPALQPAALRADTVQKLSDGSAWTASPSPETSFIGACQRGPFNGVCASGGSAAWGPGLGWILLVAAAVVLIVVLLRETGPPMAPPRSAVAPDRTDGPPKDPAPR